MKGFMIYPVIMGVEKRNNIIYNRSVRMKIKLTEREEKLIKFIRDKDNKMFLLIKCDKGEVKEASEHTFKNERIKL